MVVQKTQVFAIVLQVLLFVLFLYLFGFPLINKYKDEQASLRVFQKPIQHKTRSPSKAPERHHLDTNQTRLTYNCAHLRSTKETLTIEYLELY